MDAIRTGDTVVWDMPIFSGSFRWAKFEGTKRMEGIVERHSYGSKGQHTFSIRLTSGELKLVKGRSLYQNIIDHIVDKNSPDRA